MISRKKVVSFIIGSLITISCESFEPGDPSGIELYMTSTLVKSAENCKDSTIVFVEWDPMISSDFSTYEIRRKVNNDSAWIIVFTSQDPYSTSMMDTVPDDDDLIYQLSVITNENNRMTVTDSVDNIELTHFYVYSHGNSDLNPGFISYLGVMEATASKYTDAGDTLEVLDNTITGIHWNLLDKSLLVSGNNTILQGGNGADPIINIEVGILEGFQITGGYIERGNGVGLVAGGDAWVRKCEIYGNSTTYGKGSAVIMKESARINNCLVYGNSPRPVIFNNVSGGSFINNTIVSQDQEFTNISGEFTYMNNIVYAGEMIFDSVDSVQVTFNYNLIYGTEVTGDIQFGSNTIYTEPGFMNFVNFILSPESEAINSGNPSSEYDNLDGTRNTMGYEGGPYGWSPE